jgi:hypothetical protein
MACGPCQGLNPPWTTVVQPRARQHAHRTMAHRCYGSSAVAARGGGGRGGRGGVRGALTGDGAAVKRPGNGGKAAAIDGTWWGRALARERRKGGWCGVR